MNIIISKQLTKTECKHAPATPVSECSNPASALSTGTGTSPYIKQKPFPFIEHYKLLRIKLIFNLSQEIWRWNQMPFESGIHCSIVSSNAKKIASIGALKLELNDCIFGNRASLFNRLFFFT